MKRKTVIIVGNDASLRLFLQEEFVDPPLKASVISRENGEEALKEIQKTSPDLLITDFQMPNMNGAELALESLKIDPDIPIIIMSSRSKNELAIPENLTCEFWEKEINIDGLMKLAKKHL